MPIITSLYAALLGLMAVYLGFMAGHLRDQLNVAIGDGGNKELLVVVRRHGNFAEWVPLALILIALLEMRGVPLTVVHALGAGLVVARLAHAMGLKANTMKGIGRFVGAAGTSVVIAIASVWLIVKFV